MTAPANLRVNVLVPFPSLVTGANGMTVAKNNGISTVALQFQNLGTSVPALPNYPTDFLIMWDSLANTYSKVSLSTLSAIASTVPTARLPAAAASVSILISDVEVGITTSSAPTTCVLPSVSSWSTQQQNGLELCIFDYTGQANTNNITPTLNGTDVFVQGITPVINRAFGLIKLRPILASPAKWYVRGIQ